MSSIRTNQKSSAMVKKRTDRTPVSIHELDAAALIYYEHLSAAANLVQARNLDNVAGIQAMWQMVTRHYGDFFDSDEDAIRHCRMFLDFWESDLKKSPPLQ